MQQRLVKTIPSTVVTSILAPIEPASYLSDEEQRLLAIVAERHSDALELRRSGRLFAGEGVLAHAPSTISITS